MAYFAALPRLEHLGFSYTPEITDQGVAHLRELTQLKTLALGGCPNVTDASLVYLKGLTRCRRHKKRWAGVYSRITPNLRGNVTVRSLVLRTRLF
jgi:hypothetical protein